MNTIKCRCSVCNQLVTKWIDTKCIPCYDLAITLPFYQEIEGLMDTIIELRKPKPAWYKRWPEAFLFYWSSLYGFLRMLGVKGLVNLLPTKKP